MQVHLLCVSAFGVDADALPQHLFLHERQQLAFLLHEGVDCFVVGQGLVEQGLNDVKAGVGSAFFVIGQVEVDDLVLVLVQQAGVVLGQLYFGYLHSTALTS